MRVGTKSILFGVHNFVLHPPLVAIAWWRLYGFPRGLRPFLKDHMHREFCGSMFCTTIPKLRQVHAGE